MRYLILGWLILTTSPGYAERERERDYRDRHCAGIAEYRLPDRSRVDCLTDHRAIEYDFAGKWHEAIGQALGYAMMTSRRAGIVLIVRSEKDERHWEKLNAVIRLLSCLLILGGLGRCLLSAEIIGLENYIKSLVFTIHARLITGGFYLQLVGRTLAPCCYIEGIVVRNRHASG